MCVERRWGQKGGPWEFNLRDMFRWCELMQADQSPGFYNPGQHVSLVYADRMRTETDKAQVCCRMIIINNEGPTKTNETWVSASLAAVSVRIWLRFSVSLHTGLVGIQKSIWGGL